jgi:hypothetical protein
MAFVLADRVKETTTTTGTGALTLDGTLSGFLSFSSAIGNSNTTYYAVVHRTAEEWEVGIGTVSAGAISRDTVISSSNSNAAVTFSSGTKDVFSTLPGEKAFTVDSVHAAVAKTTLADTDELALIDSDDSFSLKKISGANLKSAVQCPAENIVINGAMEIDQINCGAAVTVAVGTITPLVDMFYGFTAGATVQAQQVAGSGEFRKCQQFTGAASVTGITCGTRIAAKNSYGYKNQVLFCKVKTSNSLLTDVTWTAYYPTATDNYTAKTQIDTGVLTVDSTDTDYVFSFAAGSDIDKGLCIEFSVGAQVSGTWKITGIDVATCERPYPHRLDELSRCEEYWEKSYDIDSPPGTATIVGAELDVAINAVDSYTFGNVKFKTRKWTTPDVTTYSTNGTAGTTTSISVGNDRASVISYISETGYHQGSTDWTSTQAIGWHWVANARLF